MSAAKQKSVLRQVGTATIEASETTFDPSVVATRSGLYVYEGFVSRVRKHATPAKFEGVKTLSYSDLDEAANDREIGAALGDQYEFSETELCYVIDCLVSRQPNGEDGVLLNNGYANLFYVKNGPVVSVYWLSGGREWDVDDWDRYDGRWHRGDRAFRN